MQRTLFAAALAASTAACAVPKAAELEPGRVPLQASIVAPIDRGFLLSVNRPAYVALFEVLPNQGASLIYPWIIRQEQPLESGSVFALEAPLNPGRWLYRSIGSPYAFASQPRFIFLVASEAPLPIHSFQESPVALKKTLGYTTFTSMQPYKVMDRLAEEIVPVQSDDEWSTDVYVDWGSVAPPRLAYRALTCADGRLLLVPAQFARIGFGCPGDALRASRVAELSTVGRTSTRLTNGGRRGRPGDTAKGGATGRAGVPAAGRPGGSASPGDARAVERNAASRSRGGESRGSDKRLDRGGDDSRTP
jgi:hypothetical protein